MSEFLYLESKGPTFKVGLWSKDGGNYEMRVLNPDGTLHHQEDVAGPDEARARIGEFNNVTGYFTNE